jgi:hypothetical protein
MCDFVQDKHYYFIGDPQIIEEFKNNTNNANDTNNKTHLGKFIEYIGLPYVSDWLHDAKARFEYGVISRRYYDSVLVDDHNQGKNNTK